VDNFYFYFLKNVGILNCRIGLVYVILSII